MATKAHSFWTLWIRSRLRLAVLRCRSIPSVLISSLVSLNSASSLRFSAKASRSWWGLLRVRPPLSVVEFNKLRSVWAVQLRMLFMFASCIRGTYDVPYLRKIRKIKTITWFVFANYKLSRKLMKMEMKLVATTETINVKCKMNILQQNVTQSKASIRRNWTMSNVIYRPRFLLTGYIVLV